MIGRLGNSSASAFARPASTNNAKVKLIWNALLISSLLSFPDYWLILMFSALSIGATRARCMAINSANSSGVSVAISVPKFVSTLAYSGFLSNATTS